MKFYYHPASPNCRKVSALIEILGIDASHEFVDLPKGMQAKPEFLAINPNGMVPALVDGDTTVVESNCILIYIADKVGSDLWPEEHRLEILVAKFRRHAKALDGHLEGREWLVGDAMSLADLAVAAQLTYADPTGLPVDEFPNIRRWYDGIDALPAWQTTRPALAG
jgi:glutathione S-transferase